MRVLHITPGLPPAPEGLGEYAVHLGRRLHDVSGGAVVSEHIAAAHRPQRVEARPGFVDATGDPNPAALARAVASRLGDGPSAVLLHYVGYGYADRGAPLWLLRAARHWVRARPDVTLVTMFHELYATGGRPWQSSFWVAPVQRHVAVALARLSHGVFTNRSVAARWLGAVRRERGDGSVRFSPIFSNVGEPESIPSWEERRPVATVFGGIGTRERTFRHEDDDTGRALDALDIEAIWEIGPPRKGGPDQFHGRPVESLGILPAGQVSERLFQSRAGLLDYPVDFFTKSGVAAAYLSHGAPPILLGAGDPVPDLVEGDAYLTPGSVTAAAAARCSLRGFDWYRTHARSELAARRILPLLQAPRKGDGAGAANGGGRP